MAAVRDFPDGHCSEALALRADALYRSGSMAQAQKIYEEALRRDPDATSVARGLKRIRQQNALKDAGNDAFRSGRFEQARWGA